MPLILVLLNALVELVRTVYRVCSAVLWFPAQAFLYASSFVVLHPTLEHSDLSADYVALAAARWVLGTAVVPLMAGQWYLLCNFAFSIGQRDGVAAAWLWYVAAAVFVTLTMANGCRIAQSGSYRVNAMEYTAAVCLAQADALALLASLIVCAGLLRLPALLRYRDGTHPIRRSLALRAAHGGKTLPSYHVCVLVEALCTIVDWLLVPFAAVLCVLPWRAGFVLRELKSSTESRISTGAETAPDAARVTATAAARKRHPFDMNRLMEPPEYVNVFISSRKFVLGQVVSAIVDAPFFACGLPILITGYRFHILRRECSFGDADALQRSRMVCLKQLGQLCIDVPFFCAGLCCVALVYRARPALDCVSRATQWTAEHRRQRVFFQFSSMVLDLTCVLFGSLVLLPTVYRVSSARRRVTAARASLMKYLTDEDNRGFNAARKGISAALSPDTPELAPPALRYGVHLAILRQCGSVIADLPYWIAGLLCLCSWRAPVTWRGLMAKDADRESRGGDDNGPWETLDWRRAVCAAQLSELIADMPTVFVTPLCVVGVWRWGALFHHLRFTAGMRRSFLHDACDVDARVVVNQYAIRTLADVPLVLGMAMLACTAYRFPPVLSALRANHEPLARVSDAPDAPNSPDAADAPRVTIQAKRHSVHGLILWTKLDTVVARQFIGFLTDLPYAALSPALLVFPWQGSIFLKAVSTQKKAEQRRWLVLSCVTHGLLDTVAAACYVVVTVTLWRRFRMVEHLQVAAVPDHDSDVSGAENRDIKVDVVVHRSLVAPWHRIVLWHFVCLFHPLEICAMCCAPLSLWRAPGLYRCLNNPSRVRSDEDRRMAAFVFVSLALMDVLCAALGVSVLLTGWRARTLFQALRASIASKEEVVQAGDARDYRALRLEYVVHRVIATQFLLLLRDLPVLLVLACAALAPWRWRSIYHKFTAAAQHSFKLQVMVAVAHALVAGLDVICLCCAAIMLITWRCGIIWRFGKLLWRNGGALPRRDDGDEAKNAPPPSAGPPAADAQGRPTEAAGSDSPSDARGDSVTESKGGDDANQASTQDTGTANSDDPMAHAKKALEEDIRSMVEPHLFVLHQVLALILDTPFVIMAPFLLWRIPAVTALLFPSRFAEDGRLNAVQLTSASISLAHEQTLTGAGKLDGHGLRIFFKGRTTTAAPRPFRIVKANMAIRGDQFWSALRAEVPGALVRAFEYTMHPITLVPGVLNPDHFQPSSQAVDSGGAATETHEVEGTLELGTGVGVSSMKISHGTMIPFLEKLAKHGSQATCSLEFFTEKGNPLLCVQADRRRLFTFSFSPSAVLRSRAVAVGTAYVPQECSIEDEKATQETSDDDTAASASQVRVAVVSQLVLTLLDIVCAVLVLLTSVVPWRTRHILPSHLNGRPQSNGFHRDAFQDFLVALLELPLELLCICLCCLVPWRVKALFRVLNASPHELPPQGDPSATSDSTKPWRRGALLRLLKKQAGEIVTELVLSVVLLTVWRVPALVRDWWLVMQSRMIEIDSFSASLGLRYPSNAFYRQEVVVPGRPTQQHKKLPKKRIAVGLAIWKQFFLQILDVIQLLEAVFVFLTLIQAHRFVKRLFDFVLRYSRSRWTELQHHQRARRLAQQVQARPAHALAKRTVLEVIVHDTMLCPFLDYSDLCALSGVCKQWLAYGDVDKHWRNLLQYRWPHDWSNIYGLSASAEAVRIRREQIRARRQDNVQPITAAGRIASAVLGASKEAYKVKHLQSLNRPAAVVPQWEQDYQQGMRYIVHTSFLDSWSNIHHFFLLPVKILALLTSPILLYDHVRFSMFFEDRHVIGNPIVDGLMKEVPSMLNFWDAHMLAGINLMLIAVTCINELGLLLSVVHATAAVVLSAGAPVLVIALNGRGPVGLFVDIAFGVGLPLFALLQVYLLFLPNLLWWTGKLQWLSSFSVLPLLWRVLSILQWIVLSMVAVVQWCLQTLYYYSYAQELVANAHVIVEILPPAVVGLGQQLVASQWWTQAFVASESLAEQLWGLCLQLQLTPFADMIWSELGRYQNAAAVLFDPSASLSAASTHVSLVPLFPASRISVAVVQDTLQAFLVPFDMLLRLQLQVGAFFYSFNIPVLNWIIWLILWVSTSRVAVQFLWWAVFAASHRPDLWDAVRLHFGQRVRPFRIYTWPVDAVQFAIDCAFRLVSWIWRLVTRLLTRIRDAHASTLGLPTRLCSKLGLLGDLMLTVYALCWMCWPLAWAYASNTSTLWVPLGIFSCARMVWGRSIILRNWR